RVHRAQLLDRHTAQVLDRSHRLRARHRIGPRPIIFIAAILDGGRHQPQSIPAWNIIAVGCEKCHCRDTRDHNQSPAQSAVHGCFPPRASAPYSVDPWFPSKLIYRSVTIPRLLKPSACITLVFCLCTGTTPTSLKSETLSLPAAETQPRAPSR